MQKIFWPAPPETSPYIYPQSFGFIPNMIGIRPSFFPSVIWLHTSLLSDPNSKQTSLILNLRADLTSKCCESCHFLELFCIYFSFHGLDTLLLSYLA